MLPIVFSPASGGPSAAVVWLHGFGDGAESWAAELKDTRAARPTWTWVHLRARSLPQSFVQGRSFPAWGDFLDPGIVRVGSKDHEGGDANGWYQDSVSMVHDAVRKLESEVDPSRIAVVGFSQGAALAAQAVFSYPRRLAGLAMLSGWMLPSARLALHAAPFREDFNVFVSHGDEDDQVAFDAANFTLGHMREAKVNLTFVRVDKKTHYPAAQAALPKLVAFLDEHLNEPPSPEPVSKRLRSSDAP